MIVDIVLPTLNRGYIIEYAIQSILRQTNENWTLLILDNNSEDNTSEVCRKYLADSRIRYVKSIKTVPIYENWQAAIDMVESDYYLVLSDDDYLHPTFIDEVQTAITDHLQPEIVIVGRGTIAAADETSIVQNKFTVKKGRANKTLSLDPKSLAYHYATCEAIITETKENLHPSMFVISKCLKNRIENQYTKIYSPEAHDYFAGVLMGAYANSAVFIDKTLVLIGGYKKDPYCFSSNKFQYFGMQFDEARSYIDIFSDELTPVAELMEKFWEYPYFSINIMKQTLLTLDTIRSKDKQTFEKIIATLKRNAKIIESSLLSQTIQNYESCLSCGDASNQVLQSMAALTEKRHRSHFKVNVKNAINKIFPQAIKARLSIIFVFLNNTISSDVRWISYRNLNDAFEKFSKL